MYQPQRVGIVHTRENADGVERATEKGRNGLGKWGGLGRGKMLEIVWYDLFFKVILYYLKNDIRKWYKIFKKYIFKIFNFLK